MAPFLSRRLNKKIDEKIAKKRTLDDKNEAKRAIKRIDNIIQEWEETWLDSREAIELLVPDLKTIICYFEKLQDPEEQES